jgi:hypothetical protein
MASRIVAIVGSYRPGGTVESAVDAILAGAAARGAEVSRILLADRPIAFCTNCRACTLRPGAVRGACVQEDGLAAILAEIETADALVLASPVNFYNVTALFRRFMERLVGFAYWPWEQPSPAIRNRELPRRAVLVSAAAMPGPFIPVATGAPRALKVTAKALGAKTMGTLWIGLAGGGKGLSGRTRDKARRLGERLARARER